MEGNKFTKADEDELRKSLKDLSFSDEEIDSEIQKAIKKSEESQNRIEDEAKKEGETVKEETTEKETEVKKEVEKSMDEGADDIEKKKEVYKSMKKQMEELQKSLKDMEDQYGEMFGTGAAPKPNDDLKKSIGDDIQKAMVEDITKSFGEKFDDIQKSFTDSMGLISKSIEALKIDVKKIGDTPIGMKAVTHAKFFEKGIEDDINTKEVSISRDKDDLIKSMQDFIEKSTDNDLTQIMENGVTEFAVNKLPTQNTIKALAILARSQNITLVA